MWAKIAELSQRFHGRVKVSFGWGTPLTNDFRGLVPGDGLAPFAGLGKAVAANGRAHRQAVGQPLRKATGPATKPRAIAVSSMSGRRTDRRRRSRVAPDSRRPYCTSQQFRPGMWSGARSFSAGALFASSCRSCEWRFTRAAAHTSCRSRRAAPWPCLF